MEAEYFVKTSLISSSIQAGMQHESNSQNAIYTNNEKNKGLSPTLPPQPACWCPSHNAVE
jgi:hypothetical protein